MEENNISVLDFESENEELSDGIEWLEKEEAESRKIYPINSDEITSSVTTYDVFNLASQVERDKIEIQPIYQRTYVWDNKKAERFIDSLWNNLPIPPLFFLAKRNGNFMVIDWQQRLTSLLRFVLSQEKIEKYLKSLKSTIIEGSKKLSVSWKTFKQEVSDIHFEDLPKHIQSNFENKEVNLVIIKPNYSIIDESKVDEIIKEIFYRLNTWWVKLSDQEIRQSLYTWYFTEKLKEYSFWEKWSKLFPKIKKFTENPSLLTESLLRWFAFLDIYSSKSWEDSIWADISYSKPFWDFLDKYAKFTDGLQKSNVDERFNLIDRLVSSLLELDEPSWIFQHKRWTTNPKNWKNLNKIPNIKYIDTLFVWLLNLFRKEDSLDKKILIQIIDRFKEDKDILDHIVRGGSSDEKYVKERVEKSISLVNSLYHQFTSKNI